MVCSAYPYIFQMFLFFVISHISSKLLKSYFVIIMPRLPVKWCFMAMFLKQFLDNELSHLFNFLFLFFPFAFSPFHISLLQLLAFNYQALFGLTKSTEIINKVESYFNGDDQGRSIQKKQQKRKRCIFETNALHAQSEYNCLDSFLALKW